MTETGQVAFVVDDEAVIAEALAMILNNSGFQASAFNNPTEALSAALATIPGVLITDVMMPQMNGIDLAIRFRECFRDAGSSSFLGNLVPLACWRKQVK